MNPDKVEIKKYIRAMLDEDMATANSHLVNVVDLKMKRRCKSALADVREASKCKTRKKKKEESK